MKYFQLLYLFVLDLPLSILTLFCSFHFQGRLLLLMGSIHLYLECHFCKQASCTFYCTSEPYYHNNNICIILYQAPLHIVFHRNNCPVVQLDSLLVGLSQEDYDSQYHKSSLPLSSYCLVNKGLRNMYYNFYWHLLHQISLLSI